MSENLNIQELMPKMDDLELLLNARHKTPHSLLGMHSSSDMSSIIIRCFAPEASQVSALFDGGKKKKMRKIHPDGLFAVKFPSRKKHFEYSLEKKIGNKNYKEADPYSFLPGIGEMDTYLFNEGKHREVWKIMGSHHKSINDVDGVLFTVWAPSSLRVSVIGEFNCWDGRRHQMRLLGQSGVWELFIPGLLPGDLYKFEILAANGDIITKTDPYARKMELRPKTASIVANSGKFQWHDQDWMKLRVENHSLQRPMNIYEVHLSSWRGPGLREIDSENENDFHNYREIACALADYVVDMGYTHVELMPVAEHPFDQSWGYQITGFYAPTSRYGTPEDFAWFVDHMHERGVGVLLDWVPAHFPRDDFSLGRFDGSALYEHQDPRQGEHRDWGTYIFNHGRCEVRNFLIGNALYWLEEFHIDGLRVDAVASMLYLNYSREDGDWIPNKFGGKENIEAIEMIHELNELTHKQYPGSVIIAEESTSWSGVSRPVYVGGLGFSFKWNMGWMHDTLEYFSKDPVFRSYRHSDLTFSLLYAYTENFVLPLSHDEVVHGKRSLLNKMPGDSWQKFANLRALFAYFLTHPGKKLMFMGGEIAQLNEWYCKVGLDWHLLEEPAHKTLQSLVRDLNHFYADTPALWERDCEPDGFEWIDANDYQQSVFSFIRWNEKRDDPVVIVANLTPIPRYDYLIGVPINCRWIESINTDNEKYGGSGVLNRDDLYSLESKYHSKPYSLNLNLPPLGVVVLKKY